MKSFSNLTPNSEPDRTPSLGQSFADGSVALPSSAAALTSSQAEQSVKMSGWLEKQAEWKFIWNRRYFSLSGRMLSYREEGATIDKKCALIMCLQREVSVPESFRVWTERGGCWLLRARSQDERDQWTHAITTSLLEEHPSEKLRGKALKQSAWLKSWNERYLTLDGLQLSYSLRPGEVAKNKYVIVSADPCLSDVTDLQITTSVGETFTLRFEDKSEVELWLSAIRMAQRRAHTLRWQTHPISGNGSWYCQSINHASANFDGKHILLFGGSVEAGNGSRSSQRELVMVSLVGEHPAVLKSPDPFEESAGARVRPSPREYASSALLGNGAYVMFGGVAGSPTEVLGDAWITSVALGSGWVRVQRGDEARQLAGIPATNTPTVGALPPRFGHSLHAHRSLELLLCVGGFDERFQPSAETFRVAIQSNGNRRSGTEFVLTRGPPLPKARALHSGVAMPNGSVVVLGGTCARYGTTEEANSPSSRTPSSTGDSTVSTSFEPHEALLYLADISSDTASWRTVPLSPPLPPRTLSPAACAHGTSVYVWCAAATGEAALFGITMNDGMAVVTQFETRGATPSISRGLSMHIAEDYCYLLGVHGTMIHRVLLPPSSASPTAKQLFLSPARSQSFVGVNPRLAAVSRSTPAALEAVVRE